MSFSRRAGRKSRLARLVKATGPARDWICGVVNLGSWVVEPEGAYQPLTIFWLAPDGTPLFIEPVGPHELREKAVESFYRVAEENAEFGLPSRVRVRISEIHHTLAAGVPPGVDVALTDTPEVDAFIESFSKVAADHAQRLTALADAVEVPDFYRSAAQILEMRPWTWLSEDDALTVSAPELGLPWAGLVVSPNYFLDSPALVLFTSRYDAEFFPRKKRERKWSLPYVPFHTALAFRPTRDVKPAALEQVAKLGWDVSAEFAPAILAFGPAPEIHEPSLAEQIGIISVQFAFASMFSDPKVERKTVAGLYASRMLLRLPGTTWTHSVDLSIPLNALSRICAAAVNVPPPN